MLTPLEQGETHDFYIHIYRIAKACWLLDVASTGITQREVLYELQAQTFAHLVYRETAGLAMEGCVMTNREVMRQARNSFVWNLNTDLDNISACEQWAKMLRKNIDALNEALAVPEPAQRPWQGLTEFQFAEIYNNWNDTNGSTPWGLNQALEAKLRNLNK